MSGNKFLENRAADGGGAIFTAGLAHPATVNLSGNLFQANVSETGGGAISVIQASVLTSKGDKFIGNVARTGQGGGIYLVGTGASTITGSLVQGNVAGNSGGLRIAGGATILAKSIITGNVAGIFYNAGTLGIDAATTSKLAGNAATFSPNIGKL